jgi:prepilin-type N-terminal cleavage/methylation domain-containing protein
MTPSRVSSLVRRRGFTLIELTIVIGIVIILVAILIPTVSRARRNGKIAREKQAIETFKIGLEEYHNAWKDYPAVIDPSQVVSPITMDADNVNQVHIEDGAKALLTCLGLRLQVRAGSAPYGPFIELSQFSIDTTNHWLLDPNGLPYIYIPATAPATVITLPNRFVGYQNLTTVTTKNAPMYNWACVPIIPNSVPQQRYLKQLDMQQILGASGTGALVPPAQASYSGSYLLWAAGADSVFGFPPAGPYSTANGNPRTDDITNFSDTIPVNLKQ